MQRGIVAAALACAVLAPSHAAARPHPQIVHSATISDQYAGFAPAVEVARRVAARPIKRKRARPVKSIKPAKPYIAVPRRAAHRHVAQKAGKSLAGFPAPLVAKVRQLERSCGARVVSAFRPHARVAGSGRLSNHALRKAVDMTGNPRCIYAHMNGWPGGYSTDYPRVGHIHISHNRAKEWGLRFAHYSGHRRYARLSRRAGYGG